VAIRRDARVGGLTASRPVLRIFETPEPQVSSEAALGRFWRLANTLSEGLEAEDGRRFKIIYPGRPGGASGPDFRDAVIAGESGERFTGDVELHLVAPDWYRHRHHEDPAYNGVVLHVVLHPAGSRSSVQRSKGLVPIVSMRPVLTDLRGAPTTRSAQVPVFEDLGGALDTAGDRRFFSKASGLGLELGRGDPSEVLYRGVMEVLGYANNRRPFRHLAEAVPFSALASLRGEPGGTRLAGVKATLLVASGFAPRMQSWDALELKGLAPYLPKTSRVPVKEWTVSGGRPGNHPMRRVIGAAHLMDRFIEGGLLTGVAEAVAEGRAVVLLRLLRVAPHVGEGRAREIAVNAALPFLYAWAGLKRDRRLKESSLDLYRRFPKLPGNAVTREMASVLGDDLTRVRGLGARRQQGLIHWYKAMIGRGGVVSPAVRSLRR
jgi:hypothetical protein